MILIHRSKADWSRKNRILCLSIYYPETLSTSREGLGSAYPFTVKFSIDSLLGDTESCYEYLGNWNFEDLRESTSASEPSIFRLLQRVLSQLTLNFGNLPRSTPLASCSPQYLEDLPVGSTPLASTPSASTLPKFGGYLWGVLPQRALLQLPFNFWRICPWGVLAQRLLPHIFFLD